MIPQELYALTLQSPLGRHPDLEQFSPNQYSPDEPLAGPKRIEPSLVRKFC